MATKLVLVFIASAYLALYSGSRVAGSTECSCIQNSSTTIKGCIEMFSSCSEVQLIGEYYTLDGYISMFDKSDIALIGLENTTSILCSENAGLNFTNITNLIISNLHFENCGHVYTTSEGIIFAVAVLIMDSNGLSISKTQIRASNGTGLALLNVAGRVKISECKFEMNRVVSSQRPASGGGGLYLELALNRYTSTRHPSDPITELCTKTDYIINECDFTNNNVTAANQALSCEDGIFAGIGWGGGMSVRLRHYPCGVQVTINDSLFHNNSAGWGGALEIEMCRAQNNVIRLTNSNITANKVTDGGGGLDISLVGLSTQSNVILLENISDLSNNSASYGGGVVISTRYTFNQSNNSVIFTNCTWRFNSAHYASALDIFPTGVVDAWNTRPEITLRDCTFQSNYRLDTQIGHNMFRLGEGVIMVTGLAVVFGGNVTFVNNSGSCVYAISSELEFQTDANVLFLNNTAEQGAGISLTGLSVIAIHNNSMLTFCNNSVSRKGGAIFYHSIDKHIYVHEPKCFIQKSDHTEASHARLNFFGNTAPQSPVYMSTDYRDSSIFTTVDLSFCCPDVENCTFDDVGNFSFSEICTESMIENLFGEGPYSDNISLSTSESEIKFPYTSGSIQFIPGHLTNITPLEDNMQGTVFDVSISDSNVKVVQSHHTIHNNKMILFGEIGESANITLTEKSSRKTYLSFEAELKDCPPFYKLVGQWCSCYTNKDTFYVAFFRCHDHGQASLREGYWIGYAETLNYTKRTLYTGYCPKGYCRNVSSYDDLYYQLPTDPAKLDTEVCAPGRRGVLCGECVEGRTVYFYSRSFVCGKTDLCHLGLLFYLLSEILPLTILFLFVIFFDVSFTAGNLNGFILFTQMYDAVADVGGAFLKGKNRGLGKVQLFHQIIYRFFNLDFFGIEHLSFCLWKNANTLSILMFKYVTVVYAFVLVLVTIWVIKICNRYKLTRLRKSRYSVIQGLSAFLVLAYSQCTEVSFSILNPIQIHNGTLTSSVVVYLQGNVMYFSKAHLPYAIPALLCILSFVTLVPLVLIAYPLCNKILAFLGLAENRFINKLLIPVIKIKPLLDCFQGTFKDEYRFFAGLYFLYRAAILASRFAPTIIIIYTIMELQLITMLTLHTIVWPYQKRIHNIIDALLIANLAIITILKLLTHSLTEANKSIYGIAVTHSIELVFVSLPLLVLAIYIVYLLTKKVKRLCKNENSSKHDSRVIDAMFFDDDLREQSLNSSTDSYMLMRERQMDILSRKD